MTVSKLAPAHGLKRDESSRVIGVDLARAVALAAIMLVHVKGRTGSSGGLPTGYVWGNSVAPALFALLAGVSLAIVARRATAHRDLLVATAMRGLFIGFVGILLTPLDSGIAIILSYFGLLFLVSLPLLKLSVKRLWVLAVASAVFTPILSFALRPHLPPRAYDSPALGDLLQPWEAFTHLTFTGYYPVNVWIVYLLVGLALGKMNLGSLGLQLKLLAGGTTIGLGASLLSKSILALPTVREALLQNTTYGSWATLQAEAGPGLFGTVPTESPLWLLTAFPHGGTFLDIARTTGFAIATLALCLLLVKLSERSALSLEVVRVLAGAGAMALSLYTLHVIMHTAWLPPADVPSSIYVHWWVVFSIGSAFAVFSLRGPLEYLAHGLSRLAQRLLTYFSNLR